MPREVAIVSPSTRTRPPLVWKVLHPVALKRALGTLELAAYVALELHPQTRAATAPQMLTQPGVKTVAYKPLFAPGACHLVQLDDKSSDVLWAAPSPLVRC